MLATWGPVIIGGILIVLGLIFNWARNSEKVRKIIEKVFLGGLGLFEKDRPYSNVVRWLGWESIVAGALIMFPTNKLFDMAVAAVLALLIVHAVRRFKKHLKEEEKKTTSSSKEGENVT